LRLKRETLVERWLDAVLETYSTKGAEVFRREEDPFANPVGHALKRAVHGVVDSLLDEQLNEDAVRNHLNEMLRIRAVQDFAPSGAVGIVFDLKRVIREEVADVVENSDALAELAEMERIVDRIALLAFDSFVQHREQVYQLRINEVKRRVAWVVERLNQRAGSAEDVR